MNQAPAHTILHLMSFLGMSDRRAAAGQGETELDVGPLARAWILPVFERSHLHIVDDRGATRPDEAQNYVVWLRTLRDNARLASLGITVHSQWPADEKPSSVVGAFQAAASAHAEARSGDASSHRWAYNLSSGTSSMGIALALLATSPLTIGEAFLWTAPWASSGCAGRHCVEFA